MSRPSCSPVRRKPYFSERGSLPSSCAEHAWRTQVGREGRGGGGTHETADDGAQRVGGEVPQQRPRVGCGPGVVRAVAAIGRVEAQDEQLVGPGAQRQQIVHHGGRGDAPAALVLAARGGGRQRQRHVVGDVPVDAVAGRAADAEVGRAEVGQPRRQLQQRAVEAARVERHGDEPRVDRAEGLGVDGEARGRRRRAGRPLQRQGQHAAAHHRPRQQGLPAPHPRPLVGSGAGVQQ